MSEADAEDVAQEVFLVLSRRLSEVIAGSERAFLLATARRVVSTRQRSARRHPEEFSERWDEMRTEALDPEELHGLSQARLLLDEILDAMGNELREVFVLFELERLSGPAIAELLEIPLGTVNTRVRRSREIFRAAAERSRVRDAFRARTR